MPDRLIKIRSLVQRHWHKNRSFWLLKIW